MADETLAPRSLSAAPSTSGLGARFAIALALVIALVGIYAVLGALGAVPLPRSLAALAATQSIRRGTAVVTGYYVAQPFVSYGGVALPPYVFANSTASGAPAVHVRPALEDLHAGRMVVIMDLATGDGSRWSPYAIHSLMRADIFSGLIIIGVLLVVVFAFGVGGPLQERLSRGPR